MNLNLVFLIPDHLRHKLMFVCPTCSGQTFLESTAELSELRCCHCGASHDGRTADFEVLTPPESATASTRADAPRSLTPTRRPHSYTTRRNPS